MIDGYWATVVFFEPARKVLTFWLLKWYIKIEVSPTPEHGGWA
jgi:hypothetical protein